MGGLFKSPRIPGPDPSIAENARLERDRLRSEKTSTNKQISSRRKARRGGNRMLLNALHGGTAGTNEMADMTGLSSTLGSKQG